MQHKDELQELEDQASEAYMQLQDARDEIDVLRGFIEDKIGSQEPITQNEYLSLPLSR